MSLGSRVMPPDEQRYSHALEDYQIQYIRNHANGFLSRSQQELQLVQMLEDVRRKRTVTLQSVFNNSFRMNYKGK